MATKKQDPTVSPVKARVLVDGNLGKVNDVVLLDTADLPQWVGVVDADPAAVAYAESLKG